MYEGSLFLYDLPVNRITAAKLTLISGPLGTTLNEGSLTWSSSPGGNVRTENFIVESGPECGDRERFELEVSVLSCDCLNNGVCHTGESGEVACTCEEGYHGKLYAVSALVISD